MTCNSDMTLDVTTPHQVERDIILGLIYLEREARIASLMHLAMTIKSSMSDYLSNRPAFDKKNRRENHEPTGGN